MPFGWHQKNIQFVCPERVRPLFQQAVNSTAKLVNMDGAEIAEGSGHPGKRLVVLPYLCAWLFCLTVLSAATVFWSLRECGYDLNQPPGVTRDDVYYDNIAFNLNKGTGFSLDFADKEWLIPYGEHFDTVDRRWIFTTHVRGPTTSRAPVYPWLVAKSYSAFGRRWDIIRVFQIVLLPIVLSTFLVWCGLRIGNPWLAPVAAVTLCGDYGVLSPAGQIMTESTGILTILATLVLLDRAGRRGGTANWIASGIAFGVSLLVRSTLVGWLFLAGAGWIGLLLVRMVRRQSVRHFALDGICFFVAVAAVCSPWWYRNCSISKQFEPFGSAGSIGMFGGYSDGCVALQGNWDLDSALVAERAAVRARGFNDLTLPEQEHLIGEESKFRAKEWIFKNVSKLPLLMLQKGLNHLAVINQIHWGVGLANMLLVGATLAGCWLGRKSVGQWIMIATLLSLGTTMLTWSHYGRFAIPIRPFWHVACAISIVSFWGMVFRICKR